jgi:hypothetical protein
MWDTLIPLTEEKEMARVTYVKSAKGRKDGRARRCSNCGIEILPGAPYKWFASRIGRYSQRKDFCADCRIRPSMMTTSPHLSTIYAGQEAAEDALAAGGSDMSLTDIADAVRGYAEALREASESYGESADNIEDGFGHETSTSADIREKADECESLADTVESAADDIEGMDDPEADEDEFMDDFEGETDEDDKPVDADEWAEHVTAKRDERREAAIDAANDALSESL